MDLKSFHGFICLLYLSTGLLLGQGQGVCKTTNSPCKCDTEDGLIDLSPLDNPTGNPYFYNTEDDEATGYYSYNLCTPYTIDPPGDPNGCVGVLGCQQLIPSGSQSFALGTADSAVWQKDTSGNYVIQLSATDPTDYQFRTMVVTLTCEPTASTPTFEPSGDDGTLTYPMSLTSMHACPNKQPPKTTPSPTPSGPPPGPGGLSIGSILCIIFAVVVTVYLVGGCMYNYFRKGARGQEVIPHVEKWKELPYFVKDGAVFVIYKIKGGGKEGYQKF